MAQNPLNTGEEVAQSIPGVQGGLGILMMLRKLTDGAPGGIGRIMEMLGAGGVAPPMGQGRPQYRPDQPLPRSGGVDANGNPIIIPPGQGGF